MVLQATGLGEMGGAMGRTAADLGFDKAYQGGMLQNSDQPGCTKLLVAADI